MPSTARPSDLNTTADQQLSRGHNPRRSLKWITFLATMGGILFGYDTGVVNGALVFIRADLHINAVGEGLIASSLLLGAAAGAAFTGRISDARGRRRTLAALAVGFIIATILCSVAPTAELLIAARFLLGICVGGASVTVPVYLAELAPTEERGRIVTQNEVMIVTGQLIAFIFNAFLGSLWPENHIWRWMMLLATLPAVVLWFGTFILPESPRWLAARGRNDEALGVLQRIRSQARAQTELKEIQRLVTAGAGEPQARWRDLLAHAWTRRILLIGVGMAVINQISGVNAIMYYSTSILNDAGFGLTGALWATIANGVVAVAAGTIGMMLLRKARRKRMLIVGLSGTVSALFLIGLVSLLTEPGTLRAVLFLLLMLVFLAFMQGAIGPTTWLVLSEIFPMNLRGAGMGLSTLVLWLVNFLVGLGFPLLASSIGISSTFFLFVALGLGGLWFLKTTMPETVDHSLEDLESGFRQGSLP